MNCPYCNNMCIIDYGIEDGDSFTSWHCSSCFGKPYFYKWNDKMLNNVSYILLSSIFFEVGFDLRDDTIYFKPNTNELTIHSLKTTFIIDSCVTPNNLQEIYQRLINLKAFL